MGSSSFSHRPPFPSPRSAVTSIRPKPTPGRRLSKTNAGFGSVGLFHIAMYRFKGTTAHAAGSGSGFGEASSGCDVGCCTAAEGEGLGSGPLHESSRIPATTTMDARRTTTPIMQMMMSSDVELEPHGRGRRTLDPPPIGSRLDELEAVGAGPQVTPIEAGTAVLDVNVDRSVAPFQRDPDAVPGGGATVADAVGHQLGDEEKQHVHVSLGQVVAPFQNPPAGLARSTCGHEQFDALVLPVLRDRPRHPHRAPFPSEAGYLHARIPFIPLTPRVPDGIPLFRMSGVAPERSGAVLGDCPPIPPVLAEPHHLGPVRVQFHPGIVAGVMGGQVALLVERVEPAEPASRGR